MRRTLHELTTEYAAATGCSCEIKEGSCQATLSVEGLTIQIGLAESSGMILFQTGVALLPADTANRDAFCLNLLAANNLFSETRGFTLGVDEERDLVTLQLAWDLSRLDTEGFARIVHNLLAVAADWMIRLDEWRPSAPEGNGGAALSDFSPDMRMLQV